MNNQQLERMHQGKGFIAALDQSGGSTPGALEQYGIGKDQYKNDDEMFGKIHEMRTRVITASAFSSQYILGAIMFEGTMDRDINGKASAEFLWKEKGIVPFLKIDKGMEEKQDGVRIMKSLPQLKTLLDKANANGIFGTKMRSVILQANSAGIKRIVEQQFEFALRIAEAGLVPIIEPEVDIHSPDKKKAEDMLLRELLASLKKIGKDTKVMFKLSIPSQTDLYHPLMADSRVVRVLALSGGYSRDEANTLLALNKGMIASFSRALLDGLKAQMSDKEFDETLEKSIKSIYSASIT